MKRPVIGIAGVLENASDDSPFHAWKRIFTSQAYTISVERGGGIPVMLPPLEDPSLILEHLSLVDGVLFQGGGDIDPSVYGEKKSPLCGTTNKNEDLYQVELLRQARKAGKPILGICKGFQVINVGFGGTLFQDLTLFSEESLRHNHYEDATHPCHEIHIKPASLLWDVFHRETMEVNSLHHQILHRIGAGLSVIARATDGAPEAIQANEGPFLLAVQWHPEAMMMANNDMEPLFAAFTAASANA
jgi:putative glutamine amidotransferase